MEQMVDAAEQLTRAAIAKIPDGTYTFEDYCDNDAITEDPIRIVACVTVRGEEIAIDFTGSSPQVRGGMNAPLAVTVSAACYAIKCITDPENLPNSGSYRPIKVNAPYGTVVNPMPPAPVIAGNHETASRIVDVIIGALASAVPDRVCAAGSGSSGVLSLGARVRDDGRDRELLMVETHGAGQGANRYGDGVNARRVNVGNTGNTPSEVLEISFPLHILRYAISEDGGGAGRTRGGTGILRELRLDHDATVTLTADRAKFAPYGLFGGSAGAKGGVLGQASRWHAAGPKFEDGTDAFPERHHHPLSCRRRRRLRAARRARPLPRSKPTSTTAISARPRAREYYGVRVKHDPNRAEGSWVVTGRQAESAQ